MSQSDFKTVVALLNGMIGGVILVIPCMGLKSGYLAIGPVVLISGFISYYSCRLCVKHLQYHKDLDQAVLHHFGSAKYKLAYDICIAISIIVLLLLYFDLICKQWSGLTSESNIIPILNAIVLFPVIYIMKKYHLGTSLLAYGIVSTIGFCLFIAYMWSTAPTGPHKFKSVDQHYPELAAALSQGFAIQSFFIPILRKNPRPESYIKLLTITYCLGTLVYLFISYGGSLSILNRINPDNPHPETITEYFAQQQWEVILLHIIYLVHLYSAFPQFLLISKKRVFSAFNWAEAQDGNGDVLFKEVIYTGIIILGCLIIKMTNLGVQVIIEINGSIISFIFVTVIPVGIHLKCIYFTKNIPIHIKWQDEKAYPQQNVKQIEMQRPQSSSQKNQNIEKQPDNDIMTEGSDNKLQNTNTQTRSTCNIKFKNVLHQGCDLLLVVLMFGIGISTMAYTLKLIIQDSSTK